MSVFAIAPVWGWVCTECGSGRECHCKVAKRPTTPIACAECDAEVREPDDAPMYYVELRGRGKKRGPYR